MIIKSLYLKNFIGMKKVENEKGEFKLEFPKTPGNIILLKGENGYGKSTFLENLHPYINMIHRDIKDSIIPPAQKIIKLVHEGNDYECNISWDKNSSGKIETNAYIYKNGKMLVETSKGDITPYEFQVNKEFGDYLKFKNSVFLKQGSTEIVESKPSERLKIINKFMPSLEIYEKSKSFAKEEENKTNIELKLKKESLVSIESKKERYQRVIEKEKLFSKNILETKLKEKTYLENQRNIYKESINNINSKKKTIKDLKETNSKIKLNDELPLKISSKEKELLPFKEEEHTSIQLKKLDLNNLLEVFYSLEGKIENFSDDKLKDLKDFINDYEKKEIENKEKELEKSKIDLQIKSKEEIKSNLKFYKNTLENLTKVNEELKKYSSYNKELHSKKKEEKEKYNEVLMILETFESEILELKNILSLEEIIYEKEEELEKLENKIEKLNKDTITFNTQLNDKEKRIEEYQKDIKILPAKVYREVELIKKDLLELTSEISILKNKEKNLEKIENQEVCPTCFQKINESHKKHIKNEVISLEDKEKTLKNLNKELLESENYKLITDNNKVNQDKIKVLKKEIKDLKETLSKLEKEETLSNNQKAIKKNIVSLKLKLKESKIFNSKLKQIKTFDLPNNTEEIKSIFIKEISKMNNVLKDFEEISNKLIKLNADKNKYEEEIKSNEISEKTKLEKEKEIENLKQLLKSIILFQLDKETYEKNKTLLNYYEKSNINYQILIKYKEKLLNNEINIENFSTYYELNTELENEIKKAEKKYKSSLEVKNNNELIEEKLKILRKDLEKDLEKRITLKNNKEIIEKLNFEISNIKLNEYTKEKYDKLILEYENFDKEYKEWLLEKSDIDKEIENFKKIEEEIEVLKEDLFQWKKLKLYSDRIKKAVITDTFSDITDLANNILNNEGTISLELAINHVSDRKFEILVKDKTSNNIVKDIYLLSGAEKITVTKAINFALAQSTSFKTLWLDESDGSLSPKNREMFPNILKKLFNLMPIDEIFLISHMNEIEEMADYVYDFNKYVNKYVIQKEIDKEEYEIEF